MNITERFTAKELDEYLRFLDGLRETGVTNMFGAATYLQQTYPELSGEDARKMLAYWMETFSQRHNSSERQERNR